MSAPGGSAPPPATRRHYDRLDPDKVTATLDRLREPITRSFVEPRHLADVVLEVRAVVGQVTREPGAAAPWHRAVRIGSRVAIGLLVVLIVVAVGSAVRTGATQVGDVRALDWLQIVEAGVNDVVFAGLAIFFLRSVPDRIVRRRTLGLLHRLRSLAHIFDMHQMSKDPESLLPLGEGGGNPGGDPMSRAELGRYYDYCSELLSLVAKVAALCAEASTDAVVLETVSEIENLTNGMSRKIWQKISLLRPAPLA